MDDYLWCGKHLLIKPLVGKILRLQSSRLDSQWKIINLQENWVWAWIGTRVWIGPPPLYCESFLLCICSIHFGNSFTLFARLGTTLVKLYLFEFCLAIIGTRRQLVASQYCWEQIVITNLPWRGTSEDRGAAQQTDGRSPRLDPCFNGISTECASLFTWS